MAGAAGPTVGDIVTKYIDRMTQQTRHAIVALGAAAAAVVIYLALGFSTELWVDASLGRKADGALWRFNVATGSVSTILLVVTLSIGPIRVLRGGRRAVHLPWRRATGVWAALFALLHLPGGLAVHSRGWNVFAPFGRIVPEAGNLVDSFGVAYWAGLGALTVLAVLAFTSRDLWLRRLGPLRWKRLHRLSYVGLALVTAHALSMQYSERRDIRHAALTAAVLALAVALQLAGSLRHRREVADGSTDRPGPGLSEMS